MSITINDIAKIANVSPSTVSRVVNDSPLISDETKEKVRKIMISMDYTPNSIGKQLATSCSNNIGFIINTKDSTIVMDQFFYNIIIGSHNVVLSKNYDLTICDLNYLKNDDNFLSRFVYSKKVDGLIIHNSILDNYTIEKLNSLNFPYVSIGQPIVRKNTSWVDIDNVTAGELSVDHLLTQGYKRIAFIGGTKDEPISTHRLKGIARQLKNENNIYNEEYICESNGTEKEGYQIMKKLLSLNVKPDAVIAVNNYIAFGALKAVRDEGFLVPNDFGIITFDNYPLAKYTTPTLTSFDIDTLELGKMAGEILLKRIAQPQTPNMVNFIVPKLQIRNSTLRNL